MKTRPRRRRARPPEELAQVLCRALTRMGLTDQARRLHMGRLWTQIVGPQVAARTAVQSFSRGVLWVKAASPTWQNELSYLKVDILSKLNGLLDKGTVKDLKVVCGTLSPPLAPARPHDAPILAQHRAAAQVLSAPIADGEVRGAFEAILLKHFCREPRL